MSRENVELVVEQFEAANLRDFVAITDAWAEDVTLVTTSSPSLMPGPRT